MLNEYRSKEGSQIGGFSDENTQTSIKIDKNNTKNSLYMC